MNGLIAFEGDNNVGLEIIKLREKFSIQNCIETGTQYGKTTQALKNIFSKVITIEADSEYAAIARTHIDKDIIVIQGKSQDVLRWIHCDNVIYYLDAHGCNIGGCPLKEELEIIATKNYQNVCIAIHDFKVPDKDFGFDTYDYPLEFSEIENYLHNIYPKGFNYHYNDVAEGAYRGIIYIYPKK